MVQQAQETGQSALTCHIYHVDGASEIELCLRKVATVEEARAVLKIPPRS